MIWQRVREGEGASSWTKMRSGLEEARLQPVTLALHRLLGNDAARFEQTYSSSESTSGRTFQPEIIDAQTLNNPHFLEVDQLQQGKERNDGVDAVLACSKNAFKARSLLLFYL